MIVITGASSGLGAELAKLYDAEGKATYLTGRSESKLSTVTNRLSNNVGYRACDLASHQEVEQLILFRARWFTVQAVGTLGC